MKTRTILVSLVAFSMIAGVATALPATAARSSLGTTTTTRLERIGSVVLADLPTKTARPPAAAQTPEFNAPPERGIGTSTKSTPLPLPNPPISPVTTPGGFTGFNGLTHFDSRLASNGNQFSVEPPDQALCASNDFVFEGVNEAIAVFTPNGFTTKAPTALNAFFGQPPAIKRSVVPPKFGPSLFDPHCYYDADTDRWFFVVDDLVQDPATGDLTGTSYLLLAVSQSGNPNLGWNLYRINTTDASTQGCPCFADYPKVGADQFGFYISANEFSLFHNGFLGAEIFAISKSDLAAGSAVSAVRINGLPKPWNYTVHPATSPNSDYETAAGGTEYFLTLNAYLKLDDEIAVLALTNTSSLDTPTPSLSLSMDVIQSEVYGLPALALQKPGPIPLANQVGETQEGVLDTRLHRMNDVKFADGQLWSGTNTIVGSPERTGIAWFVVNPDVTTGAVTGTMTNQGYVAVGGTNSVIYPGFAVNDSGKGMMVFTLTGPDYFPSAAYTSIDALSGTGDDVSVAAAGYLPDDGFTCYDSLSGSGGVCRWGDYSQATATPNGNLIGATEYIPNHARTLFANWGTYIFNLFQ